MASGSSLYPSSMSTAGINIEDSSAEKLIDPALAAAKIVAIKQRNPEVFVNARVDTYWLRQHADTTSTIQRALRYVDAGADGVFVPLANDPDELAELTKVGDRQAGHGQRVNRFSALQRGVVCSGPRGSGRERRRAAATVRTVRRTAGTLG